MMLFQRRIFYELTWNALSTLFLLLMVLLLVASARILHELETLSLLIFVRSIPIFVAASLDLVLPVSVLVAVVVTYGRATGDNEIDSLRACGVHPIHLYTPGLVFGALMMIVLLVSADYAKPIAERNERRLTREVDVAGLLEAKLSTGEPVTIGQFLISADEIDPDGTPRGIRVQRFDVDLNLEWEIRADRGEVFVQQATGELTFKLVDWERVKGGTGRGQSMDFALSPKKGTAELQPHHLTSPQLMAWIARPEGRRARYDENEVRGAVHLRLASSAICMVFVMLGLPVALVFKRKDRVGAYLLAFLLALFVYYPAIRVSKALVEEDLASPFVAGWIGPSLILVIGLLLSTRIFRQ